MFKIKIILFASNNIFVSGITTFIIQMQSEMEENIIQMQSEMEESRDDMEDSIAEVTKSSEANDTEILRLLDEFHQEVESDIEKLNLSPIGNNNFH